MKKHLLGLLLFIVTVAGGFAVAPVWYQGTILAHGVVINGGGGFSAHVSISSWFINVYDFNEGYETPEKAKTVFERSVADAVKIIEIVPDERAVLLSRCSKTGLEYYSLVKVQENRLRITESTSLWLILDFEKSKRKF